MKQVFFDIDTQIDFMFPAGALYVPGAERLLPAIARLNRHAAGHGIPLISTMCAHSENDPEFRQWPPHCVVGTVGQQKPSSTLAGQIFLEKQQLDLFSNPTLPEILRELQADEYVVYGVVTEHCVRLAAMGLLALQKPVTVFEDAIEQISPGAAGKFKEEFRARGGKLTKTPAAIASAHS
ncbi:MAG: cysteine hydrolase [Acidobacteriota bacterium]|nr:cysteine hydrolase [Acidobacteriota bacterium]